jgi:hypothetical protein
MMSILQRSVSEYASHFATGYQVALHIQSLQRVNCTHYRAAALLSTSPQLAESFRAAKRFRVVPEGDTNPQNFDPLQGPLGIRGPGDQGYSR